MTLFNIGDDVEQFVPEKGYRCGKIVGKFDANLTPSLFDIQQFKLFRMPLTRATVVRWIVKLDNTDNHIVFPENPKRIVGHTLYVRGVTGDVTFRKLVPPAKPVIHLI